MRVLATLNVAGTAVEGSERIRARLSRPAADIQPDTDRAARIAVLPVTRAPGVVKVKVPFTNPRIVGKFPFHCHILEHEDGGMMANVRVRAR